MTNFQLFVVGIYIYFYKMKTISGPKIGIAIEIIFSSYNLKTFFIIIELTHLFTFLYLSNKYYYSFQIVIIHNIYNIQCDYDFW